jgi:hypothetical protein
MVLPGLHVGSAAYDLVFGPFSAAPDALVLDCSVSLEYDASSSSTGGGADDVSQFVVCNASSHYVSLSFLGQGDVALVTVRTTLQDTLRAGSQLQTSLEGSWHSHYYDASALDERRVYVPPARPSVRPRRM